MVLRLIGWGAIALMATAAPAHTRELTVATWNLGWHLDRASALDWIAKCGAPFEKNAATGQWEPSAVGLSGWELEWGRDAPIVWDISARPPCDVYQTTARRIVPVTIEAYDKRVDQIRQVIADRIRPDVIAFQEVSGEQAVRDVLPGDGADYRICSFSDFKVQRLAFAWKADLGEAVSCAAEASLSLPELAEKDRVRPGLKLMLSIGGKVTSFYNVHLKSSCVTPIETPPAGGRGDLAGDDAACLTLQKQVAPLERWLEQDASDGGRLVLLGDFNRNLWHEARDAASIRTDGSDPKGPIGSARVRSLIGEVIDGEPSASSPRLLHERCDVSAAAASACESAERPTSLADWRAASATLARYENLGCRNPIGLDHILVGPGFGAAKEAGKTALGKQGRTLPADQAHPDPLLALSDHCPLSATLTD